jgi:hypothetical protein
MKIKPTELVIVLSHYHAREKGFEGAEMRHRDDPSLKVWWPELGISAMRGRRFDRVTADAAAVRQSIPHDILYMKSAVLLPGGVWLEL